MCISPDSPGQETCILPSTSLTKRSLRWVSISITSQTLPARANLSPTGGGVVIVPISSLSRRTV